MLLLGSRLGRVTTDQHPVGHRVIGVAAATAALLLPLVAVLSPASAAPDQFQLATPFNVTPKEFGLTVPVGKEPAPLPLGGCEPNAPVETRSVGDKVLVLLTCGFGNQGSIYAAFMTPDGLTSTAWTLIGRDMYRMPRVRDIAIERSSGDIGVLMSVGSVTGQSHQGTAKFDAQTSTWTALSTAQAGQGIGAFCIDEGSGGDEPGSLSFIGDTLYTLGVGHHPDRDDSSLGRVSVIRRSWTGMTCGPSDVARDVVPVVVGAGWRVLPGWPSSRVTFDEVSAVPGHEGLLISIVRENGTEDWSDDTSDVVAVDPRDGTVTTVLSDLPGRIGQLDLVESGTSGTMLVTRGGVVTAYPLDGGPAVVLAGAVGTATFIDPVSPTDAPPANDPGFVPFGYEGGYPERRSAVMLPSGSSLTFAGPGDPDNTPGSGPRTPELTVGWADGSQPGGLRTVQLPTSSAGDAVQWRVRDISRVDLEVVSGQPVLIAPCGVDTVQMTWSCVSAWSAAGGWTAPLPVREGVHPRAVLSGGTHPVLVAPVYWSGLRTVVRDVNAPDVAIELTPSGPLQPGVVLSGYLHHSDDLDASDVSCEVSLDGARQLSWTVADHDPSSAFPGPPGQFATAWSTGALGAGTHRVDLTCVDRGGNAASDQTTVSVGPHPSTEPPTTEPPTTEPPTTEPPTTEPPTTEPPTTAPPTTSVPTTEPPGEPILGPPSPVRSLQAVVGSGRATLSWLVPTTSALRDAATGYRVELLTGATVLRRTTLLGPASTETTIAGLVNGTTYDVRVTPLSAKSGDGASSSVAVRPLSVPTTVASIASKPLNGAAVVSWTAPLASESRAAPTGYRITLSPADKLGTSTWNVGAAARSITLGSLLNGTTYTAKVVALSAVGTAPVKSVYARPIAPPARPSSVTVKWLSGGRTVVSWVPKVTAASPVDGHRVYVNGSLKATVAGSVGRSVTFSGHKKGVKYTFVVQASNAVGTSSTSSGAKVRPIA